MRNAPIRSTFFISLSLSLLALASGACDDDKSSRTQDRAELLVECVDPGNPSTSPLCPANVAFECGAEQEDIALSVNPPAGSACSALTFTSSLSEPYPLGTHNVSISAVDSAGVNLGEVCATTVTVADSVAPVGTSQNQQLWPPNHKMVEIDIASCVTVVDSCDSAVKVAFTRVTSNEVTDGKGDGHHSPDIEVLDCSRVNVRRERSGNGGGRVYTLDWIARDAAGNESTGSCTVGVAHDQGKGKKDKTPSTTPSVTVDIDPSDCIDTPPGDDDDDSTSTGDDTSTTTTSTETSIPPG